MIQWAAKLQSRERILLFGGACFLLLVLLYSLVYSPLQSGKLRYRNGIQAKAKQYEELLQLREDYKLLQKQSHGLSEKLRDREPGFTLFSFLEKASDEAGVKPHIKYMKPSLAAGGELYKESQVELKLERITLPQLVAYLLLVESSDNVVFIKRISIKESSKEEHGFIDVILQAITYV